MHKEQTGEVSLRQIVSTIKGWYKLLLRRWLFVVIAGVLGGLIGFVYAFVSKPNYTASLNFILANNTSGSSGLLGLAGQFGIDLGSNSNDVFTGDNIISLMTSRTMVQKALLRNVPEANQSLVNYMVQNSTMNKLWDKNARTKGAFPFPSDSSKLSYVQDSLMRAIYKSVRDNILTVSRPDKTLSIYQVSTTSDNELIAYYLTSYLVEGTSRFYIDTKTSVAKNNLSMLQHEADSLGKILSGSIATTARVYDNTFNLNSALQAQRAPAQEGQLRVTALGTAYTEVMRNLELAKITLQKETPLYQIIDQPHLPLEAEKPGKLMSLILGGILGGMVAVIYLIGRNILSAYA